MQLKNLSQELDKRSGDNDCYLNCALCHGTSICRYYHHNSEVIGTSSKQPQQNQSLKRKDRNRKRK